MAAAAVGGSGGLKLRELCARIKVDYDEARYTLARGVLPKQVAKREPGRGNHRQFDARQAFYLAVVLKLKAAGINTTLAAEISGWSQRVQDVACNGGWDPGFAPFAGELTTSRAWFVEVGDARFVRWATDANPSFAGMYYAPWLDTCTNKSVQADPVVVIRLDIARIAEQLSAPARE